MESLCQDGKLTIFLEGEINSTNAASVDEGLYAIRKSNRHKSLVLNFAKVSYVSSAGLRVLLKLKKEEKDFSIEDVDLAVYDVLAMTGFTQMIPIRKQMPSIDVAGKAVIGEGRAGIVYRIDKDTIVKVYKRGEGYEQIEKELDLSREAFILGIPTAISFEVVKVGDKLGAKYEMIDCLTLDDIIKNDPSHLSKYIALYAGLLNKIRNTSTDKFELPDKKRTWEKHLSYCLPYLEKAQAKKAKALLDGVPECKTFVHGDCHVRNILSDGKELFLIDMGALSTGYPLFELAALYRAYYAFDFIDEGNASRFFDLPQNVIDALFEGTMARCLAHYGKEEENKIAFASLVYLLSWNERYDSKNEARRKDCARRLNELIPQIDNLILPLKD